MECGEVTRGNWRRQRLPPQIPVKDLLRPARDTTFAEFLSPIGRCYARAVHLEYQIDESDYLDAIRLYGLAGFRGARLRLYILPAVGMLVAVPMGVFMAVVFGLGSLMFLPLPVLLGSLLLNPLAARRRLVRSYRANLDIQRRNFVDVDDRGVRIRDLASDRFQPWQDFSGYAESRSTFIRLQAKNAAFSITPKRELTDAQVAEFRLFCQAHLPARATAPPAQSLVPLAVAVSVILPILWLVAPPLFR